MEGPYGFHRGTLVSTLQHFTSIFLCEISAFYNNRQKFFKKSCLNLIVDIMDKPLTSHNRKPVND